MARHDLPRFMLLLGLLFVSWSSCSVWASRAHAQHDELAEVPEIELPASADDLTTLERAHAHFLLGLDFFRARDYRKALAEFESAAKLSPTADLWFNIGRVYEELGQPAQAAGAFTRYLRDRVDAPDAPAVKARIAKLDALAQTARVHKPGRRELGSVRIRSELRDGAAVYLDGRPVSAESLQAPLLLEAGRHQFDATAPGHIPLHAVIDVQPGLLTTATAALRPLTVAQTHEPSHGLDYALFGVAGAAAAVGAAFATMSAVERSNGAIDDARAWALRADVSLAGTALCALVGGVLYVAAKRRAPTELLPSATSSH